MSRPSLFHVHPVPEQWPGEDDVHGARIGPRYNSFQTEPGLTYVAFADDDEYQDALLARPDSVNIPGYSRLFAERPAFEFKVASAAHHVYKAVPIFPEPGMTVVVWWRRPRHTTAILYEPYLFPWSTDAPIRLFRKDTREWAASGSVRSVAGAAYGRGATGYLAIDLNNQNNANAVIARDMQRAWQAAETL